MNASIYFKNKRNYKGELIGDIIVKSKKFENINCPENLNSSAIDEFLVIFYLQKKQKVFLRLKIIWVKQKRKSKTRYSYSIFKKNRSKSIKKMMILKYTEIQA